jgi:CubicO group peptidase (beta-lactamase class C family)
LAFEWQTADPESQGMASARLDALREELQKRGTKTLLVIRNDRIVYEWYAPEFSRTKPHGTASLAKALVGGVSLALAMNDGLIAPDDFACQYIPQWRDDPKRAKITIRHLATHSSGIQDAEHEGTPHEQLPGWMGAFWKREPDPFTISRDQAPILFEPGAQFHYSNPGMAMLAYAVTASLTGDAREGRARDIRTLLRDRVMRPIGVPDKEWSCGYGRTYEVDGLPLVANWGGGGYSPNAVARVGRLFLRKGDWEGQRLIRREIVEQVLRDAGAPVAERVPPEGPFPKCGLAWYNNSDGVWPKVPRDAFAGAGAGNQVLFVVPSLNLIAVRNGGPIEPNNFWGGMVTHLFNPIMDSITAEKTTPSARNVQPPYPPSPVIRGVAFSSSATIVRRAIGSDNWPLTWSDDGALYTAYGDGWGFEPMIEEKLSLGFAKIVGSPGDFRGLNIRSETGERLGDGKAGPKAGGMLMVRGKIYMWVRNTNNATLAWSDDRANTWQWGLRFEESFGCPCFLNFGANYDGARDEYIYTYSPDGPSAYESYDRVILARAPIDKIADRSAYEFLQGTDGNGAPRWTADLSKRGFVLQYPSHCQRIEVVHNAGLTRYLMLLTYNHESGWGIFDAPAPWGPWTTAFHTESWDVPGTHGYRLPTKWMSRNGREACLVFSGTAQKGYDAFCTRGMRFE